MKERVAVAISGGVDSAVAAALLVEQGFEVIGLTMCFHLAEDSRRRAGCCSPEAIDDARKVARLLGIRHYVLSMQKELEEKVIRDFYAEYLAGRTPNPCVRCNQFIKFGALLRKALSLDAKYLATGHYARVVKAEGRRQKSEGYFLKKARDKFKDQSYFLYRLSQSQLRHSLFPLGDYTKVQVREMARKFALPVAEKPGSQEVCFLPGADYRGFIKRRLCADIKPGPIIDKTGKILGQHKGIAFYTVGQREGLGIAAGYPLYIIKIDARNNEIIVGRKEDALHKEFLVREAHFINQAPKKKIAAAVKIRYNHKEAKAQIKPLGNHLQVTFREKQFAVTPGQSAVFYDQDTVLGGGIIDKVRG